MALDRYRRGVQHHLYGVRGTAHPRAKYTLCQRSLALYARYTEACSKREIITLIGCAPDTLTRWFREYEAECARLPQVDEPPPGA